MGFFGRGHWFSYRRWRLKWRRSGDGCGVICLLKAVFLSVAVMVPSMSVCVVSSITHPWNQDGFTTWGSIRVFYRVTQRSSSTFLKNTHTTADSTSTHSWRATLSSLLTLTIWVQKPRTIKSLILCILSKPKKILLEIHLNVYVPLSLTSKATSKATSCQHVILFFFHVCYVPDLCTWFRFTHRCRLVESSQET